MKALPVEEPAPVPAAFAASVLDARQAQGGSTGEPHAPVLAAPWVGHAQPAQQDVEAVRAVPRDEYVQPEQ